MDPETTATVLRATNPRRMKRVAVIAVGLALILLVLVLLWYNSTPPAGSAATLEEVAVTASDLSAAYDRDAVAADLKYGDRTLQVTGALGNRTTGLGGDPVLTIGGSQPGLSVTALFDAPDAERLAALTPGTQITVTCESVTVIAESPALERCTIS